MEINLKNIEEIIFFDKKVKELLPEFRHFFDQWHLGKTISVLGGLGSKSVLDLLNSLDKSHIEVLEKHFGEKIIVNKLNTSIVQNHSLDLDENLCGFVEYRDFCAYRNKDEIFLSFWR